MQYNIKLLANRSVKTIYILPEYNYTAANHHFFQFEKVKNINNIEAFKCLDNAMLNRPAYPKYMKEKSVILLKMGYSDEAFDLWRYANDKQDVNNIHIPDSAKDTFQLPKSQNIVNSYLSAKNNKPGKPHRTKKWVTIACFIIISAFTQNKAKAQNIQGTVRIENIGTPLQNIKVEAISESDTTKRKNTLTDNTGYYELNDILTGINNIPASEKDKMSITYNDGIMHITIKSQTPINSGSIYDISGQNIGTTQFIQTGASEFKGQIRIQGSTEKILLFSDGIHTAKKIILGTLTEYETENPVKENITPKSAKSSNENNLIFRLDDGEEDLYQPVEEIKPVDFDFTNYFDFEMEKWPSFFSDLLFNLQDKYNNLQANTTINVDELNGLYSLSATTDNNGDAEITEISVPASENKLIPDSLDFAVEILSDYLVTHQDTLRKVTDGSLLTNYHNLRPKQQEFFADLYTTIKNAQTGNPIEGVEGKLVLEGSTDTTSFITNALGQANFEDIEISAFNEITPDTLNYIYKLNGAGLEQLIDTLKLTNGTFNEAYQMTEEEVPPVPKDYTLIINSKDGNGNNLENVDWLALTADSVLIGQGNTGANSLDTLLFQNLNPNLDIILKSNLTEHTDYRIKTNLVAEQEELRTTNNTLLTYLYDLGVIAKDSETQTPLDSTMVEAYLNGNLLMSGNSLEETIVNLQTTQPGHNLDLKLLIDRIGYEKSDSIPTTITEGAANEVIYNLVKETPEQKYSIIRRRIKDPTTGQLGTTADIILSNSEFNFSDTIFSQPNLQIWTDTIPVNSNGITEYNMKIIPKVQNGNIPCYTEEKTLELEPNQTYWEEDILRALEQEQKIKGKIVYSDSKTNATGLDIIIWNSDRTAVLDSIRSADGTYESGPYAVGFSGFMDVHIPNDHPTNKDEEYFGHKGIPIVLRGTNNWGPSGGPVLMEDQILNFADSIKTYNINLTPTHWIDAETGMLAQVNPAHIQRMDGDTDYDMPLLKWGETNTYFEASSENNQWLFDMAERIRNNFGIPFVVNEVSTPRSSSGINITSLDDDYLNSVKSQMGMNVEVQIGSGLTQTNGSDDLDEINVHSTTDIRFRGPPVGQQGNAFMITGSERELLHRMKEATDISSDYYTSIGNYTAPNDLDTTKMVYDHINYSIMDNNRRMRINSDENERTNNGSWTLRPNNDADYYSNTTQSAFYNEERWKHWDSTNIPTFNLKFFE